MGIFDGVDLFDGTGSFGLGLGGFDVSDFLGATGDGGFGTMNFDLGDSIGSIGDTTKLLDRGFDSTGDFASNPFGKVDTGLGNITGFGDSTGNYSSLVDLASVASNGGTKNSATSGSNAMDWVSAAGKAYELYNAKDRQDESDKRYWDKRADEKDDRAMTIAGKKNLAATYYGGYDSAGYKANPISQQPTYT